ncbi:MAG: preprotein translocase subunit SecE [Dongiaceae bacterium]
MADFNPFRFFREVRAEVAKVTWPTRKETTITTIMVFTMVLLAAIFFFLVDQVLSFALKIVLGLGGS